MAGPTEPSRGALVAGRIRIGEPLGRGGQGAVFRGEMVGPQGFLRSVAIKRVTGAAPGATLNDALLDEARLASAIHHPNVVQTLDVVEDGDEYVIVMELVDGVSLAKLQRADRRLPPQIAAGILEGALRGLDAAHEARSPQGVPLRIVHRDFSPQNILVDRFGIAKVLDFGIAKAADRAQPMTRVGAFKGKVPYAAPEQVQGEGDRRVDIWAAGVVLWETILARRLFKRDTPVETLRCIRTLEIQAPIALDPTLPNGLSVVAMRALERAPDRRFSTARAMADALVAAGAASAREIAAWVEPLFGAEASPEGGVPTTRIGEWLTPSHEARPVDSDFAASEAGATGSDAPGSDAPGRPPPTRLVRPAPRAPEPPFAPGADADIDADFAEAPPQTVRLAAPDLDEAGPTAGPTRVPLATTDSDVIAGSGGLDPADATARAAAPAVDGVEEAPRRVPPLWIAGAALFLAAGATLFFLDGPPRGPTPAPPPLAPAAAVAPAPEPDSEPERAAEAAPVEVAPEVEPELGAPAEAEPQPEPPPPKRRRARRAKKKRKKAPAPDALDCAQPYVMRDGVKVWRRECFAAQPEQR
ncbi:MAG: serine/threonine-protein kinase [Deltaproteobacteria bacterium]